MFAKIFRQIFDSSIAENADVRVTFMDMLILADMNGVVDMTHESIARTTNRPLKLIRETILELEKPDPKSRTKFNNGARIRRLDAHRDWGWAILNYGVFRNCQSEEQRRSKTKSRVEAFRKRRSDGEEFVGRAGYVYFIQKRSGGNIKIGFSTNPWARKNDLQVGSDGEFVVLSAIKGHEADELLWHKAFSKFLVRGEWFMPDDSILEAIKSSELPTTKTSTTGELRSASASPSSSVVPSASEGEQSKPAYGVSPTAQAILNQSELKRVETRIQKLRDNASVTATGKIFTKQALDELTGLKARRNDLMTALGFHA
jgi:hypothetical protein